MPKLFYVISGGTFVDVAPHFSLSAPAFGRVGREVAALLPAEFGKTERDVETRLLLTRMAIGGTERDQEETDLLAAAGIEDLRTNDDLEKFVRHIVSRPETVGIVLATATCDFVPSSVEPRYAGDFGRGTHSRLSSSVPHTLGLAPAEKIIRLVRRERKDIFLVGFKTTDGASTDDQYLAGLSLLKKASCNLVLANDVRSHLNMVITPEQARYHQTADRGEALQGLSEMIALRSKLTFTRATVVPAAHVPWKSSLVPETLRIVVDHCIERGAYKPFLSSTVGHFAVKVDESRILTSRRKTDFNRLDDVGLVMIKTEGPDSVIAYGSKPSVGGQSQRIVFAEHPDMDCIVHFHCPLRPGSQVPLRSQREFECGSHECGQNTSVGLKKFDSVLAVMLDKHGPNVVFRRDADPRQVIGFIEANFDLEGRTDEVEEDAPLLESLRFAYA